MCSTYANVPARQSTCQATYNTSFTSDLHFGMGYYPVPGNVADMQMEIMTNGSVEALMTLYTDFEQYKSGVYSHRSGSEVGTEAVRILGWGVDSNTPYWIVTIAYGPQWGNNGICWILRGNDE